MRNVATRRTDFIWKKMGRVIYSTVVPVSSISSRGDALYPNLLYPPLEEEGPPLFPHSYLINTVIFTFAETGHFFLA
jgi:hypothetical protein